MAPDDALVYTRRQWNDEKISAVPFDQFHNPYWDDISGEMMQRAPRAFIHGHVWCTGTQDSTTHAPAHKNSPHWIKVCVVRRDNNRKTFKRLLEIAGPRPKWKMSAHWP